MRAAFCFCLATFALTAPNAAAQTTFSDDLLLIGALANDVSDDSIVQAISESGELGHVLYRTREMRISSGRLDRLRQRLALGMEVGDKVQVLVVDSQGNNALAANAGPTITAWSPDGQAMSFTRDLESYRLNLADGRVTPMVLPPHYVIEDWHPVKDLQTALFLNPRNAIYREFRGDSYPCRQIDLVANDNITMPLTKNPSTDNLWSRFSPDGMKVAHYQRVINDEVPHEKLIVCREDGGDPTILIDLRKISFSLRLPWYRPKGHPVWSPNGKTIAWLINTNELWGGTNEKLEILLVDVESKTYKRHSLTDKGIAYVQDIDW